MLKEEGSAPESPTPEMAEADVESLNEADAAKKRVVTAKDPNHVWHVDLTAVPIVGFWVPWLPFALPQVWRTIRKAGATPKYIVCDKGPPFWCSAFKRWCKRRGIRPRFGAVGKHGSIAVVERFIRSLKEEGLRHTFICIFQRTLEADISLYVAWHNEHRPHTALQGRTPNEVYFGRRAANQALRFEPRPNWPRGSPCARPQTPVRGRPGVRIELAVDFEGGRKHLPVVALRRVA
jgi:hypothetical protein